MFLKGDFFAVLNELVGFQITRRCVNDKTTEEFQRTSDYQTPPAQGFPDAIPGSLEAKSRALPGSGWAASP